MIHSAPAIKLHISTTLQVVLRSGRRVRPARWTEGLCSASRARPSRETLRTCCRWDRHLVFFISSSFSTHPPLLSPHVQKLRSGAVGGAERGGGIADGDFWIGLTRVDGADQAHPEHSNTFTSCPQLYQWTDGSPASFRWVWSYCWTLDPTNSGSLSKVEHSVVLMFQSFVLTHDSHRNWYFDEPSCGGEACVVMYHQPTAPSGLGGPYLYQWNDDRCNMKHNFICKYQPGNISQSDSVSEVPPGTIIGSIISYFSFLYSFSSFCSSIVVLFSESHLEKEQGDTPGRQGTGEKESSTNGRRSIPCSKFIFIMTVVVSALKMWVFPVTCCFSSQEAESLFLTVLQ